MRKTIFITQQEIMYRTIKCVVEDDKQLQDLIENGNTYDYEVSDDTDCDDILDVCFYDTNFEHLEDDVKFADLADDETY